MSSVNTSQNNDLSPMETAQSLSSVRLFRILTVAVLACLLLLTLRRNEVWRSARTLWEDVVSKSPDKPGGHINLGREHFLDGNLKAAVQEYQIAAQLASERYKASGNPRERELLALAQSNTGVILLKSTNPQERADGVRALEATLSLVPNFAPATLPLANYYAGQKDFFRAISLITETVNAGVGAGFPEEGKLYYVRASAFCEIGALPQSNQDFQSASRIDADIPLTVCQKGE